MMNWLFGGSGGKDDKGSAPPTASANNNNNNSSSKMDIAALGSVAGNEPVDLKSDSFDPSVLERIASAAQALKESPYATDLIQLAREQERSWQTKYAAAQAEKAAEAKKLETAAVQAAEEERRRTMQFESEEQGRRAQYNDQLARKRYNDQLSQQQQLNERERQMQEQSTMRQEQERRRTVEYETELRQKTEMLKARVDAEGRIEQERKNRDIRDAQLLMQAEEQRKTVLEGIKLAGRTVGDGVSEFLSDPQKMMATVGIFSGVALGIYAARAGTSVAAQHVTRRLAVPPLVRETSRKSLLLNPIAALRSGFRSKADPLEGIILPPTTTERLKDITIATANARQNRANYRHLMLYGPPGTGKTMFARRLAQQSGLDYAILAGGDVGPLGKDAVTEIHKVFDWAESSSKGLLLFIDEADAFLRKRGVDGDGRMTEDTRNALSTFLYRTGDPTKKFMLVFSTNEPSAFDRAATDRVDEAVHLELPGFEERKELLSKYFTEYITESGKHGSRQIVVREDVDVSSWDRIAKQLEGFSGRQISKLCAAWQASAHASANNMLTAEMLERVLENHKEQLRVKDEWAKVGLRSTSSSFLSGSPAPAAK